MDQHLQFLTAQATHIEREIYKIKYPSIQYPMLVPVDTTAPPFAGSITYFSMDGTGKAEFFANRATDVPIVNVEHAKHEVRIENAAIGYDYDMFELGMAMRLGYNLTTDRAMVARRVAEELIDDVVLNGQSEMGWDGLMDHGMITSEAAAQNVGGSSRSWLDKTGLEVIKDVNQALGGLWADTRTVEMGDTLLLPPLAFNHITTTPMSADTPQTTIMDWIKANNIYTAQTGRPLMIRILRQLDKAAKFNSGGVDLNGQARMIAYRRAPDVLRFHLPMPLRFLAPQQHLVRYIVPGVFRMGGLEIRLPKAMRYVDGIWAAPA